MYTQHHFTWVDKTALVSSSSCKRNSYSALYRVYWDYALFRDISRFTGW